MFITELFIIIYYKQILEFGSILEEPKSEKKPNAPQLRMDGWINMDHPDSGTLFSHKKRTEMLLRAMTWLNLSNIYAKQKKPDTKGLVLCDFIYM